jgi:hypothetical protein
MAATHKGECADPQTMASSVATPLEEQFGQIPGITQMTSSSALGAASSHAFTAPAIRVCLNRVGPAPYGGLPVCAPSRPDPSFPDRFQAAFPR